MSKINPVVKEFPDGSEMTVLHLAAAVAAGAIAGAIPIVVEDAWYRHQCRKEIAKRRAEQAKRLEES